MTETRNEAVIWHDVECGAYAADLDLWAELAGSRPGPVLEIGCGTGRVALHLSRLGHAVTGIDTSPPLIAALRERAAARDIDVTAVVGDARGPSFDERFGLILAPMQVMQLVHGAGSRRAALAAARELLEPGGLIAVAIVEGASSSAAPGQTDADDRERPLPDVAEVDGWVYSSLPLAIADEGDSLLLTRLRQVVPPSGGLTEEVDVTRLAVLDAERLETEAQDAGLRPTGRRAVATTEAHLGSTVVLMEAR